MQVVVYVLIAYYIVINLYTFSLMGMDKRFAKRRGRRVPEKRLFVLSAIGGAAGTWLAMKVWRHKTQHRSFTVGIPYLMALNLLLIIIIAGIIAMYGTE